MIKHVVKMGVMGLSLVSSVESASLPLACQQHCHTPYGQRLGQAQKTVAYSNCNDACVSDEWHHIQLPHVKEAVTTGLKWQCVEYARRWLIENLGYTFKDVGYAYQIWDLKSATQVTTGHDVKFTHYQNQKTREMPAVGDLFIYDHSFTSTGHVAVVVGVEQDTVLIGEQNYFNRPWDAEGYARRLLIEKTKSGGVWVLDVGLMGWMRLKP